MVQGFQPPDNWFGDIGGYHQTFAALELPFDFTVSGRTVTPVSNITIFGNAYRAAPDGALTFTASVPNGTAYDLCAVPTVGGLYALQAFPSGTAPPNSYSSRLIGTAYDYPTGFPPAVQIILLPTLSTKAYVENQTDGLHVHPFGSTGYGQIIIESGGTNRLSLYADGSAATVSSNNLLALFAQNGFSVNPGPNGPVLITCHGFGGMDLGSDGSGNVGFRTKHASGSGSIFMDSAGSFTSDSVTGQNHTNRLAGDFVIANTAPSGRITVNTGSSAADISVASRTSIVFRTGSATILSAAATNAFAVAAVDVELGGSGSVVINAGVTAGTYPAAGAAGAIVIQSTGSVTIGTTSGSGTVAISAFAGPLNISTPGALTISSSGGALLIQGTAATNIQIVSGTNVLAASTTSIMFNTTSNTLPAAGAAGTFGVSSSHLLMGAGTSVHISTTTTANTFPAAGTVGNITIDAKSTGSISIASGSAGGVTLTAGSTGIALTSNASGGITVDTTGALLVQSTSSSNLTVQSAAGSLIMQVTGNGGAFFRTLGTGVVQITAGTGGFVIASTGVMVFQASVAGNYIMDAADTTYFYSRDEVTQLGYVTAAAMHHNTLVSAPSKAFVIPHPYLPGKVLSYAAVEMPEACVIHRGIATLGADGTAVLSTPPYLSALIDLTQVTVVCTPLGANPFAVAYNPATQRVVGPVAAAGAKVQWLLVGMRRDIPPHPVVADEPAGYDAAAFPYPARINAMRDAVGAAHLSTTPLVRGRALVRPPEDI